MAEKDEATENESQVIQKLRKELREANDRLSKLEPLARESAFKEAGIDLSDPRNKFFVEKYDGELDAEAIREAAEPYGFIGQQAAETQQPSGPDEQQQRMDGLRSASTPEGSGQRLSFEQWQALSKSDPAAAKEAHDSGRVDIPSYIASSLAAS